MRARTALFLVPGVLAVMASCTVDDLDLTGKSCPCADGYVCNASTNVCVASLPADPDGGAPDVGVPPPSPPASRIVVSAFTPAWQTANTVRWSWRVEGDAASFLSYEIAWADSLSKVETGAGATVVGSAQKAELGGFDARGQKTSGPVDLWTTTHGHAPGKTVFAKLTARDKNGATSSLIASATTTRAPTVNKVLFDGTKQTSSKPASFEFRAPGGEEPHYFFAVDCAAGVTTCANHIELDGIGRDLATPTFTAADFASAFLEARIVGGIATSGFTTAIAIEPAGCTAGDDVCQWRFRGWSQPGGTQPVIQVPLRELENAAGKLTYTTLQSDGFLIAAFSISGTWKDAATVRLYDARIKW